MESGCYDRLLFSFGSFSFHFSHKLQQFFQLGNKRFISIFCNCIPQPHLAKNEDLEYGLRKRLAAGVVGTFWLPPLSGMQSSCRENGTECRAADTAGAS